MKTDHEKPTEPKRVAEPVQVYLHTDDRERLVRLTAQLNLTKSDVLRQALEAPCQSRVVPAELFVDTSAWFELADSKTPNSKLVEQALRKRLKKRVRIVTTNLIIAETHALLLRRASRAVALKYVRTLDALQNNVVWSTKTLEHQAREQWLERYTDQDFSFVDAVNFAVMAERKITEALILDHRFAAAGFVMMPAVK